MLTQQRIQRYKLIRQQACTLQEDIMPHKEPMTTSGDHWKNSVVYHNGMKIEGLVRLSSANKPAEVYEIHATSLDTGENCLDRITGGELTFLYQELIIAAEGGL